MRAARTLKSWTRAWCLTLFSIGIFHVFPVQAQQDQLTDRADQGDDAQAYHYKHHHYQLVQIPTLGGPGANFFDNTNNIAVLNARGVVSGGAADTLIPDPYSPTYWWSNGNITHAFVWQDGTLTDLGSLPGTNNSGSAWISANGIIAGLSENGQIDPSVKDLPELSAVIWRQGKIVNLGSLPGGGYQSAAVSVNNRAEVVGVATNLVPDSNSLLQYNPNLWSGVPYGYQLRAFIWDQENGMQDLGTLGTGTDAEAIRINERGQVIGDSYVSDAPGACYSVASGAFIWDREHGMVDLGGLGGTCTYPNDINNKGQIVGGSFVKGDLYGRAFIWQNGSMHDLGGSLGGKRTGANAVNENGETVGSASLPGDTTEHATLWRHVGQMTDLGTVGSDPCSFAQGVNDKGQVVGDSSPSDCVNFNTSRAFLWEHGSIVDLNTLIPPKSPLYLIYAYTINNRGEIAVNGIDANKIEQAALLIPCDEDHGEVDGCDYETVDAETAVQVSPANLMESPALLRAHPSQRNHGIGLGALGAPFNQTASVLKVGALTASALNTYQTKLNWQLASGQNQTGFNIYRCHGCSAPRTQGLKIASVGASAFTYIDGSNSNPLTEATNFTYEVTAVTGAGESGPSNPASVTTKIEPAPTKLLTSVAFEYLRGLFRVTLHWTNNSTDADSYHIETCKGYSCTNFSERAQIAASATTYVEGFLPYGTFRWRVRAHSPGGYSSYSNIATQTLR